MPNFVFLFIESAANILQKTVLRTIIKNLNYLLPYEQFKFEIKYFLYFDSIAFLPQFILVENIVLSINITQTY